VFGFMPQLLYHQEASPGTDCIGGWVGPIAGLGLMEGVGWISPAPAENQTLIPLISPKCLTLNYMALQI
jgi:hypothetical protein